MTAAERGARNRRHGHDTERMVAAYLRKRGFSEARTTRSALGRDGHRAPGDIAGIPGICIETKSVASSAWPTWREQLVTETPPGDLSLLVRRVRGVADVGAWDAELPLYDWLWLDYRPDDSLDGDDEFRRRRLRMLTAPWCPRTGTQWVRATFDDVIDLLKRSM